MFGATPRASGSSPLARLKQVARVSPDVAWDYFVDMVERRLLSEEERTEAIEAIAAADVDEIYAELGESVASSFPNALVVERDDLVSTWASYILPSALRHQPKPADPKMMAFHLDEIGDDGFGPVARSLMPEPTDEWIASLSEDHRRTLSACLSGNLGKNPLGAEVSRRLVRFILSGEDIGRTRDGRSFGFRYMRLQQIFGVAEPDESEPAEIHAAVGQDLMVSIGFTPTSRWADVRASVGRGNGGRAVAELFFDRLMPGDPEISRMWGRVDWSHRRALAEAFFTDDHLEFHHVVERLADELRDPAAPADVA